MSAPSYLCYFWKFKTGQISTPVKIMYLPSIRCRDLNSRLFDRDSPLKINRPGTHKCSFMTRVIFYIKHHSHPNGFYWGHQCSWTLAPANSMQVSIMQLNQLIQPAVWLSSGSRLLGRSVTGLDPVSFADNPVTFRMIFSTSLSAKMNGKINQNNVSCRRHPTV